MGPKPQQKDQDSWNNSELGEKKLTNSPSSVKYEQLKFNIANVLPSRKTCEVSLMILVPNADVLLA
jgi:hypothetical protein